MTQTDKPISVFFAVCDYQLLKILVFLLFPVRLFSFPSPFFDSSIERSLTPNSKFTFAVFVMFLGFILYTLDILCYFSALVIQIFLVVITCVVIFFFLFGFSYLIFREVRYEGEPLIFWELLK